MQVLNLLRKDSSFRVAGVILHIYLGNSNDGVPKGKVRNMPDIPQERETISQGLLPSQGNKAQQNTSAPSINRTRGSICTFHHASIFILKDLRTEQSVRQVRL